MVRLADSPGRTLSVGDFLRRVRRMVVGFVVGRVVGREASGDLDDLTTYYLLHRNDFRLEPAPAGAVILYAVSCGLADSDLVRRLDLLERRGSGSAVRLKPWHRRTARGLGEPGPGGAPPPLIDGIHRTMQLWKTGEQRRVDAYLTARGFWKNDLFQRVLQAVVELADPGSGERSLLESLQNHLGAGGAPVRPERRHLPFAPPDRPTRP